jgi:N-methylhydantoinase B/oxoprolinase/acetone carboxylase alpha subunit
VIDAVLRRVLGRALESVCNEMGTAMIRTATSAVFVEGRDFSCALLDPRAELVAAANYDPSHLSAMPLTAEYAMMELGAETLAEGDVIVVNDPFRGGGHLTDIAVIRPVFHEGRLLALAMNRGHHIDVGGMAVAGFPGTARSIFQEGIRIPPVKWFEGGVERRQVMDLLLLNVRFPRAQLGDFRGQLASCITAEQRIRALAGRYGADVLAEAMQAVKDHSEGLMRAAIAGVPDGTYRFENLADDDGVGTRPYRVAVALEIDGDRAVVDFAGSSAQAEGPINSSFGNTIGSCFNAFLHTLGGEIAFNHGCFRPVGFRIPRGSFLNPIPPAPVFGGVTEISITIIDAVCGALAQAVPERVSAGSYGTCINVAGGGFDPERRQPFGFYFFQEGGWGATAWRDGWTSVPNPTSNFNDYPVEALESDLPLRVIEVALNPDSGGPGRFRGGLGTRRTYEVLGEGCDVNALGERFRTMPFGLAGGGPGMPNQLLVQRAGEGQWKPFESLSPSKFASLPLAPGDRFSMATGGGGGYGDPRDRDPASLAEDVREGLVSDEAAATVYVRPAEPPPSPGEPVGPPRLEGLAAEDARRVAALFDRVRARIDAAVCGACVKQGDPVRCPFHHPFAAEFWDADGIERWAARNCPLQAD